MRHRGINMYDMKLSFESDDVSGGPREEEK